MAHSHCLVLCAATCTLVVRKARGCELLSPGPNFDIALFFIIIIIIIIIMSPLFTSFEGDKPDPPGNISIGGTAKIK